MSSRLWLVSFLIGVATTSFAQAPEAPSAQRDAMKKLDFLVGRWEGAGSLEFAAGQKREFRGIEIVQSKAGGLVLTIEGVHRGQVGGQGPESVIHDAFGTVSYEEKAKEYRFVAFTSRGTRVDAPARVSEGRLSWGMSIPQFGEVRYAIRLDDEGRWLETGEVSGDGKEWRPFFSMTLRRADPK